MVHADLVERYDQAAPKWSTVVSKLGFVEAYVSLVRKANVGADQGARVLDAGCGTGAMSQAFLSDRIASTDEITLLDN
jgi:ubiquinone/menaquinone biosynthesis C-methylase UbiE